MAISFPRHDHTSPSSIVDKAFNTTRRGFDQTEVREYLASLAADVGRLQERERLLERELRAARENPDLMSARLDEEALTRLLGEETARVLRAARESATEIRAKAEENAARMVAEASDDAARIREEAETEAARRRSDAAADAEAEVSMAKQQGREMVNEARAYRERVLSELARRRELAREQIEQLIHGRDRLMQAFERARLVAVDVVAELQPIGEPDAYVDLSPTTGPVPLTIANQRDRMAMRAAPVDAPTEPVPVVEVEPIVPAPAPVVSPSPGAPDATDDETAASATDTTDTTDVDAPIDTETHVDTPIDTGTDVETVTDADADAAAGTIAGTDPGDDHGDPTQATAAGHGEATDRDVVVDLFARLRADADTGVEVADDGADDAPDDGADGEAASHVTSFGVGELQGSEIADADPGDVDQQLESSPFRQRDAEITPLIVGCAKKLKRVLADEQNEVLDRLRRSEPVHTLDTLLPWASEQLAAYTDVITDDLLEAAHAGAASIQTGTVARLRRNAGAEAVAAATKVLEDWLIAPMRDRLERCVTDGAGDNQAITRSVRSVYREWKTQRIDEQLDDIVRAAYGRGVLGAIEPGAPITWQVDPDQQGCADCADNALAGAVEAGSAFPTGDTYAPCHPGCRCLLVPVDR